MAKTDLCDDLSAITCPALVIYGDGDAPITSAAGLLGAGLQNARTVRFAGVGHHPLVEEHEQTIRAIAEALESP
jgi:pimeloyl-ACP methyl ester carboxylesterase